MSYILPKNLEIYRKDGVGGVGADVGARDAEARLDDRAAPEIPQARPKQLRQVRGM